MNEPVLTDVERNLVIELLQQEQEELPVEIHHTDSPQLHDVLQDRLKLVKGLLRKFSGTQATVAAIGPACVRSTP